MPQTFEAIFEDGVFRPLESPEYPIAQGQRVRLTIEREADPDDILGLAGEVYEGLSREEIEEIEEIALDRRTFFSDRAG